MVVADRFSFDRGFNCLSTGRGLFAAGVRFSADVGDIRAMKQLEASDFEVKVLTGGMQVNFKPTFSYYWYDRLVDPHEIKRFGSISPSARIRHMGWRGDTGDYSANDVALMAYRLASSAAVEAYKDLNPCRIPVQPQGTLSQRMRSPPRAECPADT